MNYQINEDKILFTQVGNEGVILEIENQEYFEVSKTYYAILDLIDQGCSKDEIIKAFLEEYDVSPEECTADVEAVLNEMLEKGYILA